MSDKAPYKKHPKLIFGHNGTNNWVATQYDQRLQILIETLDGDTLTYTTDRYEFNESLLSFITNNTEGEPAIDRYFILANIVRFQTQAIR